MAKRIVVGLLLAVVAVLLVACQVEQEAEDTDVTLTPTPGATLTAFPTPTLPAALAELERLRQEEASKPKFEGTLNGIRFYPADAPAAVQRMDACSGAKAEEVQHPDISAVASTPMEIVPTYLPEGAEEGPATFDPVVACGGTVVRVERRWVIPGKGDFFIIHWQGEHAVASDVPLDRLSPATVSGKPAVLVKPLVEGYDYSTVYVAEDFGVTLVAAFGLSLVETVKIAEGLK